jgi:hypothetical protein
MCEGLYGLESRINMTYVKDTNIYSPYVYKANHRATYFSLRLAEQWKTTELTNTIGGIVMLNIEIF